MGRWQRPGGKRKQKSPLIIKLAPVRATQALTGAEIIYTDSHHDRNRYAHSRWTDASVKLLQTFFQVTLEENGRFRAVIPPSPPISAAGADLLLESTLFDFSHHIKDDGTSDGVIRIRFYLINNTTKTVMATKEFSSRTLAAAQNARSASAALNRAASTRLLPVILSPGLPNTACFKRGDDRGIDPQKLNLFS